MTAATPGSAVFQIEPRRSRVRQAPPSTLLRPKRYDGSVTALVRATDDH